MKPVFRQIFAAVLLITLIMAGFPVAPQTVRAAPSELFFSEYIEGSSNNKALEIYNGTGAAVDLTAGGYNVQMYFNGNISAGLTINLVGSVADGDVFVLAQSSAEAVILAQADQTNGAGWFNGNDAVVLRKGTTIIDVIGQIGFNPVTEWGSGLTSTADNTLVRKSSVEAGDPVGSDGFDPAVQWDGYAINTFSYLGAHAADQAPVVAATLPVDGVGGIAVDTDIQITFSEDVVVSGDWFSVNCSISGVRGTANVAVSGGPAVFTLNPDNDFTIDDVCTVTVFAANVSDADVLDPPDAMASDYSFSFTPGSVCLMPFTPVYAIQGSGLAAAITGAVSTQGVVVGDYEGPSPALRGFYLQDIYGDGDANTSDGIFVFNGDLNSVSLGQVVRVSGTASEFQAQTQVSASNIQSCGEAATVAPVDVNLPFPSTDYLERFEGMLVRMPQTLYVTEHFQLGRFGQVVMSSGDRLRQPTHLALPGAPALAIQAANNLNRIIVDDELNNQNPDPILFARGGFPLSASNTLRGGDSAAGMVGVMTYGWAGNSASPNAYRLRPVNAMGGGVPDFQADNQRPAAAPEVAGSLRVASMNLLNYFNTFNDRNTATPGCYPSGTDADCRGAESQLEFDRQTVKTVAAITKSNADIIGVVEIENDGYGADSTLQTLVDYLNAATAPGTYAFIDADAGTGEYYSLGVDAIKVGLLYKPAAVTPVGQTAVINDGAFGLFTTLTDLIQRSRPALAQTFEQSNGARLTVVVNHLKSKGSSCEDNVSPVPSDPDLGDGQGNCNLTRLAAAQGMVSWLAADPTASGDADVLIIGDLNSYAKEDPIRAIEAGAYTNLEALFGGSQAYSYVFDGQWGYLDYALSSANLTSQVVGTEAWHINSDEPSVLDYNTNFKSPAQVDDLFAPDEFRISDHDAVLVDLDLNAPPTVDAGGPYLVRKGEYVTLMATATDPNHDPLTFEWDLDNDGIFETPGMHVDYFAAEGPGFFSVSVRATDDGGLSDVDSAEVIVYDPDAGFVTAGGWIDSPAGALASDPDATGKANFGLEVQYKDGEQSPRGNLEFDFKKGDLNFKAQAFEWLVVFPDGAQAEMLGSGTINGSGHYFFRLWVSDADTDTFRLMIWQGQGAGVQLVYDNGFAQPLGGGSIQIHR